MRLFFVGLSSPRVAASVCATDQKCEKGAIWGILYHEWWVVSEWPIGHIILEIPAKPNDRGQLIAPVTSYKLIPGRSFAPPVSIRWNSNPKSSLKRQHSARLQTLICFRFCPSRKCWFDFTWKHCKIIFMTSISWCQLAEGEVRYWRLHLSWLCQCRDILMFS